MKTLRILGVALFMGAVCCLASCKKEETPGSKLDKGISAATDTAKDASAKAEDAAKEAEKKLNK